MKKSVRLLLIVSIAGFCNSSFAGNGSEDCMFKHKAQTDLFGSTVPKVKTKKPALKKDWRSSVKIEKKQKKDQRSVASDSSSAFSSASNTSS